jgi:hypothetical protein
MGPTSREGRATERVVTGGDQKGKNRGVWRRLAGEQRMGGGGVGNGTEGTFYRRALEGKTGDNGCLHAGAQRALRHAHVHARCSGAGRARLAAGGVSVKETRSCAACLLRLSRRVRW